MRHTRFEAVRHRLEQFDPGEGWRLWLYEFLLFGFKQAWACLFGGLMLALLLATHLFYPEDALLHRYDFITLAAVAIQAAMLAFRLETWSEAKVILIFHIVGTVMELFKTATGSWIYPEASVLRIGDVPLFSGFMYAAVGSYIARVWRIFDFRYSHYPPRWATYALAAAIYVNFFAHHWLPDIRYLLFGVTILLFWRTKNPLSQLGGTSLDATAAWISPGRVIHLGCREYRYLRPRMDLSGAGGRLAAGQPCQAGKLVPADADQLRPCQPGASSA